MRKYFSKFALLAAIFGFALALTLSCSSKDEDDSKLYAVKREKVTGISQKGPFVKGSKVIIYELDSKFEKTKNSFDGLTDSTGYFDIEIKNGKLASPYIILEAKGRYFNEVSGKQTDTPITLKAIADVSAKSEANINALTHLEFERVLELVKGGTDFYEAKGKAQKEVLDAFEINEKRMDNSEKADIFGSSVSDSVLMVISILLQGNRNASEVSNLLGKYGKDEFFMDDVKKGLEDVDMDKVNDYIRSHNSNAKDPDISPYLPKPSSSSSFEHSSSSWEPSLSSGAEQQLNSSSSTTSVSPTPTPTPPTPTPSSSAIAVLASSSSHTSSSSEEHSSSSHESSSSEHSSSSEEHSSSSVGLCHGFVDGTERLHYGVEKAQFCDERDGKRYVYVEIGSQTWMAENLDYDASGSKCYNNQESNCTIYGRLYDWATAMDLNASCNSSTCASQITTPHRGVCPSGWHISSDADWSVLTTHVNPTCPVNNDCVNAGTKLKATSGWDIRNTDGTDDYGFSALPGGLGYSDGGFGDVDRGNWWSASERNSGDAYRWRTIYNNTSVYYGFYDKVALYSVRCVKD